MAAKFTVFSFPGSQWAGVVDLALAEKGFAKDVDYEVKDIDLLAAENFDLSYLAINHNGTVPSLTSPLLDQPLEESTDILRYLDRLRGPITLVPQDAATKAKAQALLELVHSESVDTNVILFGARDASEMEEKKASVWKSFLLNRQEKLEREKVANPSHLFYGPKSKENGVLAAYFSTKTSEETHRPYFERSLEQYHNFANGLHKLESQLVLPYAAGESVTEADFHIVPWLSHAMAGTGVEPKGVQDFAPLEMAIQKSAPGFKVGQGHGSGGPILRKRRRSRRLLPGCTKEERLLG